MAETQRPETLFVRRHGYRWALAAAYIAMAIILTIVVAGGFENDLLVTVYRSGR